jgi:hypothetical protein
MRSPSTNQGPPSFEDIVAQTCALKGKKKFDDRDLIILLCDEINRTYTYDERHYQ